MATDIHTFRYCVIEALPKNGRKIWSSLFLDFQFIHLGIKKALLFDYADVPFETLVSFVRTMGAKYSGQLVSSELMVMKAGKDSFIFHYSKFLHYLSEVEEIYFGSYSSCNINKKSMIADISTSCSSPKELDRKHDVEELQKLFGEVRMKLLTLRETDSCKCVVLSDSEEISWCTVYGIFLNYPVVYWLKDEPSNLIGEDLVNYQIRMNESSHFGIDIPKKYCVLSFTVPGVLLSSSVEMMILQWFSGLSEITKCCDGSFPSIYLHQAKANGFQTSL